MEETTTVKVRKITAALLKEIAKNRGRKESMEQIILELVDRYMKEELDAK